jgi:hypothetical protein
MMTAELGRHVKPDRVSAMLRNQGNGQLVFASMLTICVAFSSGLPAALASPLDEGSCQKLRTEQEALSVLGIDTYFEHGADWVKANLTVADYNLVKRYVNVYEQLKFRCPTKPARNAKAKGPIPPMPVRSPRRNERTTIRAKAATPG